MPPSMLEAPGNAVCPPPLTAKGHCVRRETNIVVDTSIAFEGLNTHAGSTEAAWDDQYVLVNAL
jgi:hypothetical protein